MVGLALILSVLAADDLTPEKAAAIQHDRDKAFAEVAKKYGNKKSSELSQDERREMIRDQREAETAVLDKHQVDPKELARYEAKMSLADRAATKAERERLARQEEEEQRAAAEKKEQPQEVQVQRGFDDAHPVVIEENKDGVIIVEKGLPPEAIEDQKAASGGNDEVPAADAKPKKKAKK